MTHDLINFYGLLFREGEETCFSSTLKDIDLRDAYDMTSKPTEQFFVINPLKYTRKDSNVLEYRNILIEFDSLSIEKQLAILTESKVPYSTLTYSGGKSLHAIIALHESLPSKEAYVALAKAVYAKLGGEPIVDTKTSNPSRFSRVPGALRADNGKEQKLLAIRGRVHLDKLLEWTGPISLVKKAVRVAVYNPDRRLPISVVSFLEHGAPEGSRNKELFVNACEMLRAGYDSNEIYDRVIEVLDLPEYEIRRTIASAERSVNEE